MPLGQPGQGQAGMYDQPLISPGAEMTSHSPGSPGPKPLFLCQPFVKAALVKGSFKTIVAPPKYVDVNEWVAINRKPELDSSTNTYSVRLLPQPEPLLLCPHRVLYNPQLSHHVGGTFVSLLHRSRL